MSTDRTLLDALRQLAPVFSDLVTDHGDVIEVAGRHFTLSQLETEEAEDHIQGALQRLCRRQGWYMRIVSRRRGAQARVSMTQEFLEPKRLQARGTSFTHALALAVANVAQVYPTQRPTSPQGRYAEADALAHETWGAL